MLYYKKTNLFNSEKNYEFANSSIWTSSKFFHFKYIKQQGGHMNEGTGGFSSAIKHLDTPGTNNDGRHHSFSQNPAPDKQPANTQPTESK